MKKLTRLRDIELFKETLKKLSLNQEMSLKEQEYILSIALLFIDYYNNDKKTLSYLDIAYYIILKYSLTQNNYQPLFDFASQFGFYPIVQWINKNMNLNQSILSNIQESGIDLFLTNPMSKYIETLEQHTQRISLLTDSSYEISYIAPTSFGKSEIIQEYIQKTNNSFQKIGVIVPSKSLLVQTYKSLRDRNLGYKFMLHDEMYNEEPKVIGILTQERATSLIRRKQLVFDILFVDEAHNLLERDSRNLILARLIESAKILNPELKIIYLSPLIEDSRNLAIGEAAQISQHRINFNVKSYEVFLLSNHYDLAFYDKYLGVLYKVSQEQGYYECIINHSLRKNFIYAYRPKYVEKIAKELYKRLPEITIDEKLLDLINVLKSEVHELFYITKILSKGLLFIHGKMPDLIKEFLEYNFKQISSIKYLIANSVILEGINLPIDRLFITNTYNLKGKELTNLIGRVNRLNYVFNEESLLKLIPQVYFLENKELNSGNESMINKIECLRKRTFVDNVLNPNLKEYKDVKGKNKQADENIYNQNKILIDSLVQLPTNKLDHIFTMIIENQIYEFYDKNMTFQEQKLLAEKLLRNLDLSKKIFEDKGLPLMEKIYHVFIKDLINNDIYESRNDKAIQRLMYTEARLFYDHFLNVVIKFPITNKIEWFYNNFIYRIQNVSGSLLYVGHSYGEVNRESSSYNHTQNVYIDLTVKNKEELINLALIKLKIEEDFISFKLNKMILMLYDLEVISENEYNRYVYGTTDTTIIIYCKLGLSISCVTRLIEDEQINNISLDEYGNIISNTDFWDYVNLQPKLFQFEIRKYISEIN